MDERGDRIEHSDMNASTSEQVHFLPIWIKPGQRGIAPGMSK